MILNIFTFTLGLFEKPACLKSFVFLVCFVFLLSVHCMLCLTNQEIEQLKRDKTELEDRIGGFQERIASQETELEVPCTYRLSLLAYGPLLWWWWLSLLLALGTFYNLESGLSAFINCDSPDTPNISLSN